MDRASFFVGTYTVPSPWAGAELGHGDGIVNATLELSSGKMTRDTSRPEKNPAFAVAAGHLRRLWAVTEVETGGEFVSWQIDDELATGRRQAVATGSNSPCHLSTDAAREVAYICHFQGGSLSTIALSKSGDPLHLIHTILLPDAAEGVDRSMMRSRPHCTMILEDNLLVVTDCGRSIVSLYRVSGAGSNVRLDLIHALLLPENTGPRHLARKGSAPLVYVSNENGAGASVIRLTAGDSPTLELTQIAASPGLGRARSLPAEIAAHPVFDVVYMANRFDNSISVFAVDPANGRLSQRQAVDVLGDWPRHFAISPDGSMLIVGNQNTDNLVSFRVRDGGDLEWTGHQLSVASPASITYWLGEAN